MTRTLDPCGLYAAPGHPERRIYCGPTAMAAITGALPVDVEQHLVAHRAKHGTPRRTQLRGALVRFMFSTEVEPLAEALGYRAVQESALSKRTLRQQTFAQWCRRRTAEERQHAYLVLVTNHFVAVRGDWFADTGARTPIPLHTAKHKRTRVQRVWRIENGSN